MLALIDFILFTKNTVRQHPASPEEELTTTKPGTGAYVISTRAHTYVKEIFFMGWTVGIPSMKLSYSDHKSKHCGKFYLVAAEALSERIGRDHDINPELSYKNIYYGFCSASELLEYSNNHCNTLTDAKGRAVKRYYFCCFQAQSRKSEIGD